MPGKNTVGRSYLRTAEPIVDRIERYGTDAVSDVEILGEALRHHVRKSDASDIARRLIERFGLYSAVLAAPADQLAEVRGLSAEAVTQLKVIMSSAHRFARDQLVRDRPVFGSTSVLLEYCRTAMAFEAVEQLRIFFLDRKNRLLADEVSSRGTVDSVPAHIREIVRRTIVLSASAIILVHNHPSGDPEPSGQDILLTRELVAVCRPLRITVHDHLIIGREEYSSLRELRLI